MFLQAFLGEVVVLSKLRPTMSWLHTSCALHLATALDSTRVLCTHLGTVPPLCPCTLRTLVFPPPSAALVGSMVVDRKACQCVTVHGSQQAALLTCQPAGVRRYLSDMVVGYLRRVMEDMALHPYEDADDRFLQQPLPPPMYNVRGAGRVVGMAWRAVQEWVR